MAEFSLVKWSQCLGCHMVVKKGTHIDVNLEILGCYTWLLLLL